MRQIKVQFRSFRDIRDFSQLAAKQSFQITVGNEKYKVNATSFLGFFTLNCHRPMTASFECSEEEYAQFLKDAAYFIAK